MGILGATLSFSFVLTTHTRKRCINENQISGFFELQIYKFSLNSWDLVRIRAWSNQFSILFGSFLVACPWPWAGGWRVSSLPSASWACLGVARVFLIGKFALWPFGFEAINRRELNGRVDLGTGRMGLIGNVIWFLVAGWWLAIGHLTSALACFVSIIGIPFGIQHIKLALIAIAPIGMTIVPANQNN